MDSGLRVLDSSLCQYNLDSGLQSSVGPRISRAVFRIPQAMFSAFRIPDSRRNNFPDSGIRISLHGRLLARIIRGLSMLIGLRFFKSKCLIFNAEIKLSLIHYQITCSTSESHLGLFRTTTACLTQRQSHRHDNVTTVYEPTICTEKSQ